MKVQTHQYYFSISLTIHCFLLFTLFSCSTDPSLPINTNQSIYIGAYWVDDVLVPYPKLLSLEGDSATLYNQEGIPESKALFLDSTLHFKHNHYFVHDSTSSELILYDHTDKNKLRRYRDNLVFRNVSTKTKKYSGDINEFIQDKAWSYQSRHLTPNEDFEIDHQLFFKADTLYHYRQYHYKDTPFYTEFEQYQFHLFELEGHFFLSLIDSKNTSENPLPIYEIIEFNSSTVKWINHRSLKPQIETLSLAQHPLSETDQDRATPFYVCYEAEQKLYYYNGGHYRDGAKGFLRDYQRLTKKENLGNKDQNGYIIFQFNVSCEKKLGRYGLIQMDKNFQPAQFDIALVETLFQVVNNSSSRWKLPLEGTDYFYFGEIKDIRSFVMFKIQNGEVTEVLP